MSPLIPAPKNQPKRKKVIHNCFMCGKRTANGNGTSLWCGRACYEKTQNLIGLSRRLFDAVDAQYGAFSFARGVAYLDILGKLRPAAVRFSVERSGDESLGSSMSALYEKLAEDWHSMKKAPRFHSGRKSDGSPIVRKRPADMILDAGAASVSRDAVLKLAESMTTMAKNSVSAEIGHAYALLRIDKSLFVADPENAVKRAYWEQAKMAHPDKKGHTEKTNEKMRKYIEAREILVRALKKGASIVDADSGVVSNDGWFPDPGLVLFINCFNPFDPRHLWRQKFMFCEGYLVPIGYKQ